LLCENRVNGCRLLDQAVKQLATRTGCPAVKPEGEFVEIAIQNTARAWCRRIPYTPQLVQPSGTRCNPGAPYFWLVSGFLVS
jgi:hypothetical protein